MPSAPIYLDYAATTPVDPAVARAMGSCLTSEGTFANPASVTHRPGRAARARVEDARARVAELLHADPEEIVFTSGATEANNLALTGVFRALRPERTRIVVSAIEHPSVLDTAHALAEEGADVVVVGVDPEGRVDPAVLEPLLDERTALCSVMHVNNELGTVQDIERLGALCRSRGVLFHTDAVQSAGKIPLDVHALAVDLLSLSAHKLYGPKGIGALYVRRDLPVGLVPLIHGGGHERGRRSGTLATHQIVGMGEAYRLAVERLSEDPPRVAALRDRLVELLTADGLGRLNARGAERVSGIASLTFPGVVGETLLYFLGDLAVSQGSACGAARGESSHVLKAIGLSPLEAHATIRFSLGRETTEDEIARAAALVRAAVQDLRRRAPRDEASAAEHRRVHGHD
ncbi:MAG: cysteine desulfurase [Gammaproteobacteria bacterium]|jgi:cysteine desulfurase|nr:cysteine desulfurase [Gammaproteobacteria bacterium]